MAGVSEQHGAEISSKCTVLRAAYRVPANVTSYAYYLDARIRAYRELQHDLFALQTESNRRSTGLGANCKLFYPCR